jgi:hypothetical protein
MFFLRKNIDNEEENSDSDRAASKKVNIELV